MSLNFKIIWIDDTKDWVDSVQDGVRDALADEGLEYSHQHFDRCPDLDKLLPDPELSMIAVDWNLPNLKGDEVVAKVRQLEKFVDIIFYSQDGTSQLASKHQLDRVFYRRREDVEDTIRELLEHHIESALGLNTMRGMIVAEAIRIENEMAALMARFLGGRSEFYLDQIVKGKNSPYDAMKKHTFLTRAIQTMISEAENGGQKQLLEDLQKVAACLKKLPDDVIHHRNIFAHGEWERVDGGGIVLKGISGALRSVEFTRSQCREIRKNYQKHLANLRKLSLLLGHLSGDEVTAASE